MPTNLWTDKEVRYLKKWYGKKTTQEIGNYLGRTEIGVQQKAAKLGLSYQAWTQKELDYIERFAGIKTIPEMAKGLNRSESGIRTKIHRKMGSASLIINSGRISAADVGRILGFGRQTIYRHWIPKGLKYERVGRYMLIEFDDLNVFMQKHPELWDATKCDKYYFEQYDWFRKKLMEDRAKKHEKRWGSVSA